MKFAVGYDGSNVAKAALDLARSYAKKFNAAVVILASVEGGTITNEIDVENAKKNIEFAENFMQQEGVSSERKFLSRGFKPGEDIVNFLSENEIQAVFIGIRRRSRLDKMVFGSNAQYIILNAPCAVISVK